MLACWRWLIAAAVVPFVACSSGSADSFVTGGDITGDGADEAGDTAAEGVTGTADSGSPTDTDNADGSEGPSAEDGTAGGEDLGDVCDGIDCGNGFCSPGEDGPVCTCDPGHAPLGLTCIACEVPKATDFDLFLVTGTLRVTFEGAAPPQNEFEDGIVSLRNRVSGDEVVLGNTHDPELYVAALPGVYDVVYASESGGAVLPQNRGVVVDQIVLVEGEDVDEVIDIEVGRLQGSITIDDAAPPAVPTEQGRLWLRNPDTGDSVLLGSTNNGSYDVIVVPGAYEIRYEHVAGSSVPANADAHVGDAVVLVDSEVPAQANIAIRTATLSGAIRIDSAEPPDSPYENGRLTLLGPTSPSDIIPLGETRNGAYQVKVVEGWYEVVYEWVAGSAVVPANAHAMLSPLDGTYSSEADIDIPVQTISGAFTLGDQGVPPPADPTDDGNVYLRQGGDSVYLGNTAYGAYERRVIPGVYDVFFSQDSSRGGVPTNTNARIHEGVLVPETLAEISIPVAQISGPILVGGAAPPSSDYDDGHVYLRNADTHDSVLLANTRESGFTATVVPGVYDIVYVAETPGGQLPVNAGAVIGTVDVAASKEFAVDVPVLQLAGSIAVDGQTPPVSPDDVGLLFLVDGRTLDPVYLGSTAGAGYSQRVTPGDYLVFYRAQSSSGLVPTNSNANLGCWTLQ